MIWMEILHTMICFISQKGLTPFSSERTRPFKFTWTKLIGMHLFFKIRDLRVDIFHNNPKNIQLTWMHLFFKNKKLRDDLLPKTLKIAIFIREWPKNLFEWLKFLTF